MRQTILKHPSLCIAPIITLRSPKKPLSNCNWRWVSVGGVEEEHRTAVISIYGIAPMRGPALHVGSSDRGEHVLDRIAPHLDRLYMGR
jgi:hypothetical protein